MGAACASHALANSFDDYFGLVLPIWAARVGSVEAVGIAVAPVHNAWGCQCLVFDQSLHGWVLLRSYRKSEAPASSNMAPMPSRKVLGA